MFNEAAAKVPVAYQQATSTTQATIKSRPSSAALYSGYRSGPVPQPTQTSAAAKPVDYLHQLQQQSTALHTHTTNRNAPAGLVAPAAAPAPAAYGYSGYYSQHQDPQALQTAAAAANYAYQQQNLAAAAAAAAASAAIQNGSSIDIGGVFRQQQRGLPVQHAVAYAAAQAVTDNSSGVQQPAGSSLYGRYAATSAPVTIQARSGRAAVQVAESAKRQCFHQSISPEYHDFAVGKRAQEEEEDDEMLVLPCSSASEASSGTVGFLDCCEVLEDEVCQPATCGRRDAAAFELLAEVSVYTDHSSPKTLAVANAIMMKLKIPGAFQLN
jgi:hypothetical protein